MKVFQRIPIRYLLPVIWYDKLIKSMRLSDVIIAIVCGEASALLINDLIGDYFLGAKLLKLTFLFLIPILAILLLWLADLIAKKFFFVWQLAKHLLVGLLVVLVDLKIYTLLISLSTAYSDWFSGAAKAISFLISVSTIKFFGNKYWAFEEKQKNNIGRQFAVFFIATLIGLVIDVGSFLCLIKIIMPQLGLSSQVWIKISVVIAAIVAAVWNFLSYKFIVFKKIDNLIKSS